MLITRTIKTTDYNTRVFNHITDTIEYMTVTLIGTEKHGGDLKKAMLKYFKGNDDITFLSVQSAVTTIQKYGCELEDFLTVATPITADDIEDTEDTE